MSITGVGNLGKPTGRFLAQIIELILTLIRWKRKPKDDIKINL